MSICDDLLTVHVQGLASCGSSSAASARRWPTCGATADPGIVHEPKGLRAPGLHILRAAVIGTFYRSGESTSETYGSGAHAVVIELTAETYSRLIVDVEDPRATVDTINRALSTQRLSQPGSTVS